MGTNYHDKELDLATSVCDMNAPLLQSPGHRFEKRDAEEALWLLKKFGDSVNKHSTTGNLARMRNTSDFAEPGREVLLTEATNLTAQMHGPTGFVHGTGGDYGRDQGGIFRRRRGVWRGVAPRSRAMGPLRRQRCRRPELVGGAVQ